MTQPRDLPSKIEQLHASSGVPEPKAMKNRRAKVAAMQAAYDEAVAERKAAEEALTEIKKTAVVDDALALIDGVGK